MLVLFTGATLLLASLNVAATAFLLGLLHSRRDPDASRTARQAESADSEAASELEDEAINESLLPPILAEDANVEAPIRLRQAAASRSNPGAAPNGDAWICDDKLDLYAVFDGIGSPRNALAASRRAARCIELWFSRSRPEGQAGEQQLLNLERDAAHLLSVMERAHEEIAATSRSLALSDSSDFGCKCIIALRARPDLLLTRHVGDASLYLLRGGKTSQIVGRGESAKSGPGKSLKLASYLGMPAPVEPARTQIRLDEGDRILLCSSSVSVALGKERIGQLLVSASEPVEAAERLVTEAANADPSDDMTAIALFC